MECTRQIVRPELLTSTKRTHLVRVPLLGHSMRSTVQLVPREAARRLHLRDAAVCCAKSGSAVEDAALGVEGGLAAELGV